MSTLTSANILYFESDASFNLKKGFIDASNPTSITFLPQSNAIYANKHMFQAETPNNKVTVISQNSNNTEYPTAKAVYILVNELSNDINTLQGMAEFKTNKVTVLNGDSTNTQYPSAKTTYDTVVEEEEISSAALNQLNKTKENLSNKVTSLDASCTDDQYPSAKCIYNILGNVESMLASI